MSEKQLDLRDATAEEAARALYEYMCGICEETGYDPTIEVCLYSPEESDARGFGKCWRVMWESGPYEWGVFMSLGGSLFSGELGDYSYTKEPEVIVMDAKHYIAEPYYSFDLGFSEV